MSRMTPDFQQTFPGFRGGEDLATRVFVANYAELPPEYEKRGTGFRLLSREEILMATLIFVIALGDRAVREERIVLREDADEALESLGVMGCP